jgi:hypothetical protein
MPRIVRTSVSWPSPSRRTERGNSSAVPEVGLVQVERRLAVELEQHVAFGPRDAPLRAEVRPAAVAAVANAQSLAIEANSADVVRLGLVAVEHPGLAESAAVACQAAGDRNPRRQAA